MRKNLFSAIITIAVILILIFVMTATADETHPLCVDEWGEWSEWELDDDFYEFRERTCDICDRPDTDYRLWDGALILKGDVNGDGVIDSLDALEILKYEVGLPSVLLTIGWELNMARADVNGDGVIDSLDALEILKYEVGLPSVLD
ncbi:MAG: dockerin type I repeat-containing protein [Oscillospiraceae bacterium]|jgi:hypothetical protein|nr:dockerin type I repeat-containing protein [Oscillospiraceae bacterium]